MSARCSHAVLALLRLRLESHRGEWVAVADLAHHLACSAGVVRDHLAVLELQRAVELRIEDEQIHAAKVAAAARCDSEAGFGTPADSSPAAPVQHRWHLHPRLERSERLPDGLAGSFGPHLNPHFAV